jgi:hypothetical protein
MIDEHLDRTQISRSSFDQADAEDVAYWLSKTPAERIEGVEYLRRWLYGDEKVDARLQRVLCFAELGED